MARKAGPFPVPRSEQERERIVLEEIRKGTRQNMICKMAHTNAEGIKRIRMKHDESYRREQEAKERAKVSVRGLAAAEVFNLLNDGKDPVQIITETGLDPDFVLEMTRIWRNEPEYHSEFVKKIADYEKSKMWEKAKEEGRKEEHLRQRIQITHQPIIIKDLSELHKLRKQPSAADLFDNPVQKMYARELERMAKFRRMIKDIEEGRA
jgi:hypothetical protein